MRLEVRRPVRSKLGFMWLWQISEIEGQKRETHGIDQSKTN